MRRIDVRPNRCPPSLPLSVLCSIQISAVSVARCPSPRHGSLTFPVQAPRWDSALACSPAASFCPFFFLSDLRCAHSPARQACLFRPRHALLASLTIAMGTGRGEGETACSHDRSRHDARKQGRQAAEKTWCFRLDLADRRLPTSQATPTRVPPTSRGTHGPCEPMPAIILCSRSTLISAAYNPTTGMSL